MTLVEQALSRPEMEREAYLRSACGSDTKLFAEAWNYVQWEKRMQGFLLDPLQVPAKYRPPFRPGQILINRFRILRAVAEGGMGIVWEAIDEKLDRRVALKCAKAGYGKQLPPEVRNAREISHPNVCKIFEIHTASTADGEIDFISMEFLEGETLADRIRRVPLTEREARSIAGQLCSGLAEAHRKHLIHSDLKPNNVILVPEAEESVRAVIMDFGLAHVADASTSMLGGTPAYMAPELWNGQKPSVASDIYALGVILWEVRYGRLPRDLGVLSSTLPVGERTSWKPPKGRGKWDRIIARCIDPDPVCRFVSADEIAKALGPSRVFKILLVASAAGVVAAASGFISYERATAPAENVELALLPFAAEPDSTAVSETLLRSTARQLSKLQGNSHTRYRFISLDNIIRNRVRSSEEAHVLLRASHALYAIVGRHGDGTTVHAYLTDLRSGTDAREWTGMFKPGQMRYAATDLTGFVTGTLHLPPSTEGASVNAAASKDYSAGLAALRGDKTMDQALEHFRRAAKMDGNSAVAFAGLAEAQWFKFGATNDESWLNRASDSVREAQLRNPDLPQVHRIAGLLRWREGRYEQAEAEYLRAIELEPSNGDAYRRLGEAYQRSGQIDEALDAFRKAIQIDPRQYRSYRDLADLYSQQARYGEAITQFKKALELAPSEPLLHYRLGMTYENIGQFASAEREVRSSLALAERPAALHTLGVILIYEQRDREAIPKITQALHLGQETSLEWLNLGTAYRRIGRPAEAADAYKRGLELAELELTGNPRSALIRSYLAYLCAQQRFSARAESEIAQALMASPTDADVAFMAVNTYEALGHRDAAISVLTSCPPGVLADINRWPDVEDLRKDSRFSELLAQHDR